jgi:hypothetical protein
MPIEEILNRVNVGNAANRARDAVNAIGNKAASGLTGQIENLLGTGLDEGGNQSEKNFTVPMQLRFPLDNTDEYRAFIRFQIKGLIPPPVTDAVKAKDAKKSTALETQSAKNLDEDASIADQITSTLDNIGSEIENISDKVLAFVKDPAAAFASDANSELGDKSNVIVNPQVADLKAKFQAGTYVDLYLPSNITITDGVQIENVDLGRAGAAAEGLGQNASAIAATKAGLQSVGRSINEAMDRTNVGDIGKLAGLQLLSKLPGSEAVVAGAKSALKVTTHPNTRAIFRSVNLRTFSFSFKLIPTSEAESIEIAKIIKFFREELYPETIKIGDIPVGYRFPNVFVPSIRYRHKIGDSKEGMYGKELFGITKYKDCYLTSFTAVYNPTSMGLIKGGRFQEVDITMSFQEQSALDKADVATGGY